MDSKTFYAALAAEYPQSPTEKPVMDTSTLLEHLRVMQSETVVESTMLKSLAKVDAASVPSADHHAIMGLLDSLYSAPLQMVQLPKEITQKLMGVVACVNRIAISEGILPLSRDHVVSRILASLVDLNIGLQDVKGKARDLINEKFQIALTGLSLVTESLGSDQELEKARSGILELMQSDIANFLNVERIRIGKLEQRLVETETGQLKRAQSRQLAAQTLNIKMDHQVLPEQIVDFLQGVWFDSLQMILVREGLQSEAWLKAVKLTETLIMTLQPENTPKKQAAESKEKLAVDGDISADTEAKDIEPTGVESDSVSGKPPEGSDIQQAIGAQELYRIIEHLPEELSGSLVVLEHDSAATEAALMAIETAHITVMQGEQFPTYEFEAIPTDEGLLASNTAISHSLLAPVEALKPGQWFVVAEENEPVQHIKLTLKMNELKQLLFTNRNGAKVLQANFDEFAYLLTSKTVARLPQFHKIPASLRVRLKEVARRHTEAEDEMTTGLNKIKNRAKRSQKKDTKEIRRSPAIAPGDQVEPEQLGVEVKKALELVSALKFGATFRLGDPADEPVEARLIVNDQSGNRMILVDNCGLNLGEFTTVEFAESISVGRCQVIYNGSKRQDSFRYAIGRLKNRTVKADLA